MPFASKKQKKFLEAITHNPEFAKKVDVKPASVKNFVAEAEKMPQPKIEQVDAIKPTKPKKYGKLMAKLGIMNA